MHNKITPDFLNQLLPPSVGENNRYALRNNNDYRIPSFRLSLTNSSFLPSSLQSWNALDNSVRSLPSLNSFKTSLMSNIQPPLPTYFKSGDRKLNIVHTKLRHRCSSLNYDLYRANLVNSAACNCGNPCENVFHYFLECQFYTVPRNILIQNFISLNVEFNLETILFGNSHLTIDLNSSIFRHVHVFIKSSNRF